MALARLPYLSNDDGGPDGGWSALKGLAPAPGQDALENAAGGGSVTPGAAGQLPRIGDETPLGRFAQPILAPMHDDAAAVMAGSPGVDDGGPDVVEAPTARQVDRNTRRDDDRQQLAKLSAPHLGQAGSRMPGIGGKILHGLALAGNIAGDIVDPNAMALIPGTGLNNAIRRAGLNRDLSQLGQDEQGDATSTSENAGRDAQTAYTQQRPALEQSRIDQKQQAVQQRIQQQAAARGQQVDFDGDGVPTFTDNPELQAYNSQAAKMMLEQAQTERQRVLSQQGQPGTPLYEQKQRELGQIDQRIGIAQKHLGLQAAGIANARQNTALRENQFEVTSRGTLGGQALPGSMVDEDGEPVGTAFQSNVRPTGAERGKADMAYSAEEQLETIKQIMQRHGTLFGPGYGQASQFNQWLGSQDPDAQRFIAARTIAADHLAGTFGGRSEAALDALDKAIGQFKDNPQAAIAGIDQLTKANKRFEQAGTVHTTGSHNAGGRKPVSTGQAQTQTYNGHTYQKGADNQWHLQP